ncbi:MAG TPA: NAD(P)/FAD-dependent oxidoreductase [Candidatus Omnitrophota bacterium]|nr:NAD(P)/FAD-dependent oxidoreductase [Candidatus Omnitrophota bacterium]HPT07401.1 NAD(P)/FAD-dependent oxidoreductase [Candidatus Omnitrophota bacterium]
MKVLIVGAGPIGCYTARLLKEKKPDYEVTVIEEHPEIGRPVHCAGLVSAQVLTETKVDIGKDFVLNRIDGATLFLNGDQFNIKRQNVAVVIDREKFDRALGEGLDIQFNTRFMGIEPEGDGYLVETDKGDFHADIVIGANGANSSLRKAAEFKEDIKFWRGVQFRMKFDQCERSFVRVYLRDQFFSWIIPEEEGIVRAGIISNNPYHDLIQFLQDAQIEGEILEKFAGIVPLGKCQTQKDGIFLVGDAACQVKPMTHGGIYYGMRCAEILVDCIAEHRFGDYEKEWKHRFWREFMIGLKLKQVYEKLSHDDIKGIFMALKENMHTIENYADFENHSKIISMLIKSPKLQFLLGRVIISLFEDT